MAKKKNKVVEVLGPMCAHGRAPAEFTDEDGKKTRGEVGAVVEGRPMPPGSTLMTTKAIKGESNRYKVLDEYTSPGPSRAASPAYRKGYDAISWGKPPAGPPN